MRLSSNHWAQTRVKAKNTTVHTKPNKRPVQARVTLGETRSHMLSGLINTRRLRRCTQDILSDLVEDACLGLCFEVHRAVKQGYFFLDDTDQESMRDFEIVDQPGLDVFGQVYNQWKNKECVCPNCSRSIAASRFAPHLEKCLGMGRNSSRIANRRIVTGNNTNNKSESDQEDNDDVNDNDWSYGAEKKAKKRKSDKNFSCMTFTCNGVLLHCCIGAFP
uniref:Ataxin-7-like protein 3 n=1 Tax=Stegastes partitus TaxID=144197 RepID=A0A3B5AX38_9TELE